MEILTTDQLKEKLGLDKNKIADNNHFQYLLRHYPQAFKVVEQGGGRGNQTTYELTPLLGKLIWFLKDATAFKKAMQNE